MTGPYDDVPIPPGCAIFDLELEVAAVVGRGGRDLTVEQAASHIAGYLLMNDWSARGDTVEPTVDLLGTQRTRVVAAESSALSPDDIRATHKA